MARQPLSPSPLWVWRSLIKGSSAMARHLCSLTICYFRKVCNKQKFREGGALPNPNSSLCSVSMTTYSKTILREQFDFKI